MDLATLAAAAFNVVRWISPLIVAGGVLYTAYLCISGLLPVLIRLGNGLRKRRIAIFAKGDALDSLEALIGDSKLFAAKNVTRIASVGDFGRAEDASVFLVYWPDWQQELAQIIAKKADRTALVIYAPQGHGFIPPESMALLEQHRNVVLANLRGRLLNDIVVSLITSGYEKK